jgi:uncharacterized protein YndB with AHSA1/START domain
LIAAALAAAPASAAVREVQPNGFVIVHEAVVPRAAAVQWDALVDWGGWWPDAHSYSGKADNFDLDVEPDGELEEEWDGGSVLHGSVLQAQTAKLLRLSAAFGPLQALPVQGVLDIALKPEGSATRVTLTYRVGGPPWLKLEQYAAPVDQVFAEAFARLIKHSARPPEPEEADAAPAPKTPEK